MSAYLLSRGMMVDPLESSQMQPRHLAATPIGWFGCVEVSDVVPASLCCHCDGVGID